MKKRLLWALALMLAIPLLLWAQDYPGSFDTFRRGVKAWLKDAASIELGDGGVVISDDGDGALTILGAGDGADEDLTLNLDDTANEVTITSSTGVDMIRFLGAGDANFGIHAMSNSADPSLAFYRNDGAAGAEDAVDDGDVLGGIGWNGYDGTDYNSACGIRGIVDGTPSDGTDMPGVIELMTVQEASGTPVGTFLIGNDLATPPTRAAHMETYVDDDMDDEETIVLPDAITGFGRLIAEGSSKESCEFFIWSDGTTTFSDETANIQTADADAKICFVDGGTQVTIKQRIGADFKVRLELMY